MRIITLVRIGLPFAGALALAACGGGQDDTTYTTDTVDQSGGELIVNEVDPEAVPVDLPDTPMTPVPEGEAAPAEEVPAQ